MCYDLPCCSGTPSTFPCSYELSNSGQLFGIKYIRIIYVESFARVTALSLSGKILLYVADRFFVQWPELALRYSRAEYVGILI